MSEIMMNNDTIKQYLVQRLMPAGIQIGSLAVALYMLDVFIPIVSYGPFFACLLALVLYVGVKLAFAVFKYGHIKMIDINALANNE